MAGPKKQQSLTSFFTPKATNGPTAKSSPSSEKEKTTGAIPSRKRPLQEDTDQGNDDPSRLLKRTKAVVAEEESPSSPGLPKPTTDGSKPNVRTERYLYDGSSSQANGAGAEQVVEESDDAAAKRKKEELHRKFVKKLGHPDSMTNIKRRNYQIDEETQAADEEGEGAEEEETPPPAKTKKKGAKTGKLTPMEIQFLDIKRKHMDTVLIVEVGYKFKFFGEDARIAAKELSIVCIPGKFRYDEDPSEAHLDRFASASIPVHRLPVHAKRLVAAGHKVGVVRQIETAALKKVGDNRNTPFIRKLTNVYTKGTYVDEIGELEQGNNSGAPSGGYLLCITETKAKGSGTDEKVDVGILAVQPATGDIIYDSFEDGFMRSEIETRLLHISPCEFLIVGDLTKASDKLVQHLSGSSTNVFGDKSRVERVPKPKTMAAEAYSHVAKFYAEKLKDGDDGTEKASNLLEKVLHLPEIVTICLSAMITHLTEYGLEHIFDLTKYFQSFSARSHMLINGTTLESLEVYRNATDHSEKGSLFWALDKTQTRFGQRLLRKWIGRPLLDQARLEERISAVEELFDEQSTAKVDQLEHLLVSTKTDLERSLIRIYYGKCTRPELLAVLQTLQKIAMHFARVKSAADTGFTSELVSTAVASLPQILETVVSFLDQINADAARRDDKYEFFREPCETEDISDHKLGIASVEAELDGHREHAAQKLGKKSPVTYVTVAGIEYLIEIPNPDLKKVPASWMKISGTKKLSRFHTPEVVRLISERDQHKEALAAACDAAFANMLKDIAAQYQPLRDAVSSLATLDCLLSLSKVAALPGYTKPVFLPREHAPTIRIVEGRHPIAEHTIPSGYIPFSTTLSSSTVPCSPACPCSDSNSTSLTSPLHPLAQLITGPNMGGKSSYVRSLSLLTLLSQIGSYVPASSFVLTPLDSLHTRMGASDNILRQQSTFMVEISETASILRSAGPRSLVVLDELGRGTSTHDGAAIAEAVLRYMVEEKGCLTLFITHYQSLARVVEGMSSRVRNVHMKFTATKSGEQATSDDDAAAAVDDEGGAADEEITFLYEVGEGVAHRSYGLNVARLAQIPKRVLDVAAKKSRELEEDVRMRQMSGASRLLNEVLQNDGEQLDHLVSSVEQL